MNAHASASAHAEPTPRPDRRRLEDMTAADLAPLERLIDPAYPEQLIDMATVLYVELLNQGQPEAAPLALALTEAMRMEIGGRSMYVNKGRQYELSSRDREIFDEYNGRNLHLVAKKYGLSEMRVRQILAKVFVGRQGALPLEV